MTQQEEGAVGGEWPGMLIEVQPEWFRTLYEQAEDAFVLAADGRVLAANPAAARMFGCSEHELLVRGGELVLAPLDRRLAVASETGTHAGQPRIDVVYRRPDGSRFVGSVSASRFDAAGAGTLRWVMLRDVTTRRRSEAVAMAITDIALSLLAGDPTDTVLGSVVRHARRLVDAVAGWVVVVEDDDTLTVPVVDGSRARRLLGGHYPRSTATLTDRTFAEGTVSVTDLNHATAAPAGQALDLGPALAVRLAYGDRRFGVLVVARERGRPAFSHGEREIVARFAHSASVALALETVRAEVAEHERANLHLQARHDAHVRALEMNDVIVQTLCAAKWKLEAGDTDQASQLLTEVIESAERIIADLLPPQVSVDGPAPPAPSEHRSPPASGVPGRTPFDYTGWFLPAEER